MLSKRPYLVVVALLSLFLLLLLVCIHIVRPPPPPTVRETYEEIGKVARFGFVLPVYIISLPVRRATRLEPLLGRLGGGGGGSGFVVREVHAVDGRKDVTDDRETFLSHGQAGCWLSHVHFWRKIAEQGDGEPFALVLEDDAAIRLPEMMPDLVDVVAGMPEDWDVCYLGGVYQARDGIPIEVVRVSDRVVRSTSIMWYSHAYLITRRAAAKMLALSEEFNGRTQLSAFEQVLPLDDWMTHRDRRMQVFNANPELVGRDDDGVSDTYDKPPPLRMLQNV